MKTTVGIAGLGVIGGSIGLALRRTGQDYDIVGFDPHSASGRAAVELGCATRLASSLVEIASADIAFVAVPPQLATSVLEEIEAHMEPGLTATDCTSTKGPIMEWAAQSPGRAAWFVGGHPLAGNEGSGPGCADDSLFEGAIWVLTVPEGNDERAMSRIEEIVRALGATPFRMTAADHDKHMSVLSHLPHALAGALVVAARGLDQPELGAGSWKDLTRVAGSNPALWQHVFLQNREALLAALELFDGAMNEVRTALERNDGEALRTFFEEARAAKRREGGHL